MKFDMGFQKFRILREAKKSISKENNENLFHLSNQIIDFFIVLGKSIT